MKVTIEVPGRRPVSLSVTGAWPWLLWSIGAVLGSITAWGDYWLAWMLAGFLAPQLYTVIWRVRLGPLSDNVWHWESLSFSHPFDMAIWTLPHWGLSILVWCLFAWLSVHLPFGQLR